MKLASLSDKGIGPRPLPLDRALVGSLAKEGLRLLECGKTLQAKYALQDILNHCQGSDEAPCTVIPETDIGASA